MKFKPGITSRLTLTFVLFAIALLSGVSFFAYIGGKAIVQEATTAGLFSTALEKQAALNAWVDTCQSDLVRLAGSPVFLDLVSANADPEKFAASKDLAAGELKNWAGPGSPFQTLFLLDPVSGQVQISSDPKEEGKFKEDQPFFINGKQGPFVQNPYFSVSLQSPAMTVSAPLVPNSGRLLGVLAGELNLDEMSAIINRRTGDYRTDDVFMVNLSSLFVTQPRLLSDPAVLQRGIHTQAVKLCLAKNSGTILANDYRDVPVINIYRWIPERNLCLIVQVDQAEAFAPTNSLATSFGIIYLLALLVSVGLALTLARSFTRPILTLQAGVSHFGQGDLAVRLPESSGGELGQLAHAFNQMAEALAREQTQLRSRLEQMYTLTSDLIGTIGFDGFCKDLNPAFIKLLGYSLAEVTAVPFLDFVHPDQRLLTRKTFAALRNGQEVSGFENCILSKDGSLKWLSWNAIPDQDTGLVVVVAHDISQLKQSKEALQTALGRFERIVDANIIGIVTAKADGAILNANDYYLEMLGYSRADLKAGKVRWTDITPPEYLYLDEIALRELDEQGTCRPYEKQYLRPDGSRVWVLIVDTILPGPEKEIAGFVLDITGAKLLEASLARQRDELQNANEKLALELAERQRAEDEINRLNEELEQRVRERTAQFEASNRELEAFSYSVSHDLRAPLRGIDGWSLALLEDCYEQLDDQGRIYLERVRTETRRMDLLINDLLQLSRVTRADMQIDQVDLSELAHTVINRLQAEQPGRRVDVTIHPGLTAPGDSALLGVALTNLLENAWKFTSKTQQAAIEFGQMETNNLTAFFVRDNGAGFDMFYADKLFGAFQRLHKTADFPGTGVGLATVQRIIHRHGGQIWVEARVNQGATFYFTLEERYP